MKQVGKSIKTQKKRDVCKKFSAPLTPFMCAANSEMLFDKNAKPAEKFNFADCENTEIFSSGRGALLRFLETQKQKNKSGKIDKNSIFIPRYFCPNIARLLQKIHKVEFYDALPSQNSPNFESLKNCKNGDSVLLVNFFGLARESSFKKWDAFKEANPKLKFIEDFSHTPLCERFLSFNLKTQKSFAFSSLRKSLPLPEGGILKFPNKELVKKIFKKPSSEMQSFAADSLSAASLLNLKNELAENLFYSCEAKLNAIEKYSRASAYTFEVLKNLNFEKIAKTRFENLKTFYNISKDILEKHGVSELNFKNSAPKNGFEIFAPILKFPNEKLRNSIYAKMRKEKILCGIYWGNFPKAQASAKVIEESGKILTLPLDFRHTSNDAILLAEKLSKFLKICSS